MIGSGKKHSAFHHAYYILWQKVAYNWAKKSGIKFDIIHHVSMGNYRICGDMYKFKNAHTIFGPVGGGQTTPASLRSYYNKNKNYEKFRDIVSKAFSKFNFYKKQLSSFNELYAVNDETKNIMQQVANKPCKKICEISIGENFKALNVTHIKKQPVEIVYLGRLIELKGIMLLMDVIKNIKTDIPFHVSLYGKGELENEIKQYIKKYKLENTVAVKGNIDYSQVIGVYQNADIFVHPTLRDSAGTVFIEAIANKLPIVALDQSFAHDLSEHECGLFVNTEQSKEEIINEFAGKLKELIENYDLRVKLGQNGYDYANTYLTMDYKFDTVYGKLIK
ncbi:MAG: glycosyltransferase [Eubacterium sp.]